MTLLKILTVPDPNLRIKSKKVKFPNTSIRNTTISLVDTLRNEGGIGLAAPQVGIPLKIIIIESKGSEEKNIDSIPLTILINPEIVKISDHTSSAEEGCLSVPNIWGIVERPSKITILACNQTGKKLKTKASGLLARVLQHEIDHLHGVLFTDKVNLDTLHKITLKGKAIKIEPPLL